MRVCIGLLFSWIFAQSLIADTDGQFVLLRPDVQKDVAHGKIVYADNCASCHGINLEGQDNWQVRDEEGFLPAPPHDPSGHTWHHDDDALFELVKFGIAKIIDDPNYETNMPAYEGVLEDEEIIQVLSFIVSTWPNRYREIQGGRTQMAFDYFQEDTSSNQTVTPEGTTD